MFRNLRLYRLSSPWPQSAEELSEVLAKNVFSPCGAYAEKTAGWEPPLAAENALLCRRVNGSDLLQLRTQSRVLPLAAVKEAMEDKLNAYRERMALEPPRSEVRRLKEETREELLPKALLRSERTRACFILDESLLAVDAGTDSKADWFIDQLRTCFGRFECTPLDFNAAPPGLLKRIFLGESPAGFSLGRECRMQDPTDGKSTVTWRELELADPTIRRHVADGMTLTHLGVGFEEMLTCVINQDAVVSKLKFIEGDAIDTPDNEDPATRLDADLVLLASAVRRMAIALKSLLGGYSDEPAGAR